jgi:MYXO-CTERM domain-containing protein
MSRRPSRACALPLVPATALALGLTAAAPIAASPVQWTQASGGNGHWYDVVQIDSGIGWTSARAAAEGRGGYLATVGSQAENLFVYNLVKDIPALWPQDAGGNAVGPWLGGYQPAGSDEPAGGWSWVTGESWSFSDWVSGEPNNYANAEHYLHYYWPSGGGTAPVMGPTWNDLRESVPLGVRAYVVESASQLPAPGSLALLGLGLSLGWRKSRRR